MNLSLLPLDLCNKSLLQKHIFNKTSANIIRSSAATNKNVKQQEKAYGIRECGPVLQGMHFNCQKEFNDKQN